MHGGTHARWRTSPTERPVKARGEFADGLTPGRSKKSNQGSLGSKGKELSFDERDREK